MAGIDANYRLMWQSELESQARHWHALFAWAVMLVFPLWSILDYILVPTYWLQFLYLRLGVVLLIAVSYIITRVWGFSSKYLGYVISLSIFASMSAMHPFTGMAYYSYSIGLAAAVIGSSLFLFWHLRHSFVVYVLGLLFYVAFDRELGRHDFSFTLINGGLLLFTVTIFAYLITLARVSLAEREFQTRRKLDQTRQDLEQKTTELNAALEELRFSDQEMQNELEIASEIQRGYLPDLPLEFKDLRVVGYYRPLGQVGGDFFEVLPMENDRLAVLIVDASGHGVPAALLTMIARIAFTEAVNQNLGPGETLRYINRIASQSISTIEYLTAQCLFLDCRTGEGHLANGAHRPAIFLEHTSGNVRELDLHGLILGQFPDQEFVTRELSFQVNPGDRICMITDGFEESRNAADEEYGIDRLKNSFQTRSSLSLEQHLEGMLEDWQIHLNEQEPHDDCAMLIIERSLTQSESVNQAAG